MAKKVKDKNDRKDKQRPSILPSGASYAEHAPNYLADERRRVALQGWPRGTSDSGYPVGALAGFRRVATTPGQDPQAPENLGDLMSPSTIGREGPPSSPEEFQQRKSRNLDFLRSRETQAALMQFGVSMLQSAGSGGNLGSNIGKALVLAAGAPGRLQEAQTELDEASLTEY